MKPSQYIAAILVGSAFFLGPIGLYTRNVNPYWAWNGEATWAKTTCVSNNALLNTKTRFVKSLQLVTTSPRIVFLGSSRVYRGLNPEQISGADDRIYNLGVSSLRIFEAEKYIQLMLSEGSVRTIIWGLDFFAFDGRHLYESGFDSKIDTWLATQRVQITALLSQDALIDAWELKETEFDDSDGCWTRRGLKETNSRLGTQISETVAREMRSDYQDLYMGDQHWWALEQAIQSTRSAGVELRLFVSPIHDLQHQAVKLAGKAEEYRAWKQRLQSLAIKHSVELWDFNENNPYSSSSLEEGSNIYYIDASHYQPDTIGLCILHSLKLVPQSPCSLVEDSSFGVLLNSTGIQASKTDS